MIDFLYVKNYRSLINQGYCFSNEFEIEFDGNICFIKKSNFFIENFYSENEYSVKAIIGQNGVGKSTVLKYISNVLAFPVEQNDISEFILIHVEVKSKTIFIYTTGEFEKSINAETVILDTEVKYNIEIIKFSSIYEMNEGKSYLNLTQKFNESKILFFTNIVDFGQELDYGPKLSPEVINLSSNHLLKFDHFNTDITHFKINEVEKNIQLILNHKNQLLKSIKLPEQLRISVHSYFLQTEFSKITQDPKYKEHFAAFHEIGVAVLNNLDDPIIKSNPKNQVYFWLSVNLIYQVYNYSNIEEYKPLIDIVKSFNDRTYHKDIVAFFLKNVDKLDSFNKQRSFTLNEINWHDYLNGYNEFIDKITALVESKYFSKYDKNSFEIILNNESETFITSIVNDYYNKVIENEFMYFTWRDMSTGELALMRLFANINFFHTIIERYNTDEVVFLIDEIDAFFHPHWQKTVFNSLNEFINFKFSGKKIQIIFTSHSPFVISDLKKSEIIFLQRKDSEIVEIKELEDFKQTFGANIHTLFVDSFFVQNGLIGDFALKKINTIIRNLGGLVQLTTKEREKIRKTILQIGEPVIQRKLIQMYNDRFNLDIHERLDRIEENLGKDDKD